MSSTYDWNEILKNFSDKELYKSLYERDAPDEKKIIAERMLLERGIIQKNTDGKYIAELVEQKHLNFVAYNLRKRTDIETINELINRGLNEATAVKLVGYYHTFKEKQKKRSKVWYCIAPILILLGLYIEIWLDSIFGITLYAIAAVGIGYSSASITNYKKLTFYKILNK